jgi:alpha-tubulin suppressor-like RCC1 family protein
MDVGQRRQRLTNIPLAAQSGVAAIAGGGAFSLALKTNGAVIGWGGGSAATNVPVALTAGVTKIAAGEAHGLALKDGGVVAWGSNTYGQCDVPDSLTNGVEDVAAGGFFSVALKAAPSKCSAFPRPTRWNTASTTCPSKPAAA